MASKLDATDYRFSKMMKKLFKFWLLLLLAAVITSVAGLWGLYGYGLNALPENTAPAREPIPMVTLQALWVSETGSTSMFMTRMSPWNWVRSFAGEGELAIPPSANIAGYAARKLLGRNQEKSHGFSWHVNWCAATIWVSRNWSAEEAISTILNESYFGHGFWGIKQAAQGYFGIPVENLTISESVLLAGLIRSPSRYDPWCNPQHANTFAKSLLVKMERNAEPLSSLIPEPVDACKKSKDKFNETGSAGAKKRAAD